MRSFIVGASGRLGRLVVSQALQEGHEVTAFVRSRGSLPDHPALSVVLGSVSEDAASVSKALAGHDAVISALGNPLWLKGMRGPAIVAASIENLIKGMRERGVRRIVVPLAWGTGASLARSSLAVRIVAATLIRRDYRDFSAAEEALTGSELDWTIAYFGMLTNAPAGTGRAASVTIRTPANLAIGRADLAHFLVESAVEGTFVRQRVVLSGPAR